MGKKKAKHRVEDNSSPFDKARDELLSHIIHCGVLQAQPEQQKDWFDDTMEYMAERSVVLRASIAPANSLSVILRDSRST